MDTLTVAERSRVMSLVRSQDTKPEMRVRKLVHAMGYRYRLHSRKLSGTPDLVFASRAKVIFVHGCFWHRHPGCKGNRLPKSRQEFWRAKLNRNKRRDMKSQTALRKSGWGVLVIWECETRKPDLASRIGDFLGSPGPDAQNRSTPHE